MQGATWCNHLLGASARHRYLACSTPLRKISRTPASVFDCDHQHFRRSTVRWLSLGTLSPSFQPISIQSLHNSAIAHHKPACWVETKIDFFETHDFRFSKLWPKLRRTWILLPSEPWHSARYIHCNKDLGHPAALRAHGMKKQSRRSMMKGRNKVVQTLTKYMSLSQKWSTPEIRNHNGFPMFSH